MSKYVLLFCGICVILLLLYDFIFLKGAKNITEQEYMNKKFDEIQNERIERYLNVRVRKYDTAVTIRCKASQKYEFDKVAEKMGVTSNELYRYAMKFVVDMDTEHLRSIIGKRI